MFPRLWTEMENFYRRIAGSVKKRGVRGTIFRSLAWIKDAFSRDYEIWIGKNEPDEAVLKLQRKAAASLPYRPLISLIVPVYNTQKEMLLSMIASVEAQTYDNWQLCVADGNSDRPYIKEILKGLAERQPRAKIRFLDSNRHISGNSNEALSIAEGEYAAFLDHDDELAPFALYEVVKSLNEDPGADFLYSDEDKISRDGKRRYRPHFKPDWSPDTMLSHNYVCHLSVIRKSVIEEAGGFREGYEGSQDYDLFLRVSRVTDRIRHIPKVLYHWRAHGESAAQSADAKSYAYDSAKKAIIDHLKWSGHAASVSGVAPGTYRVRYQVKGSPEVSIIIPANGKTGVLETCVSSILEKTSYPGFRIIIVANGSRDEKTCRYYSRLRKYGRISILSYDQPFNYSPVNNYAASKTGSDYLLFLHADMEIINGDWLTEMLGHAQRKEVGAVGARLYYPNGRLQHAGVILGVAGVANHFHRGLPKNFEGYFNRTVLIQNLSAVTAACLMMRREVFEEVEGFDERYAHAYNDVDLCMKVRAKGYLIIYTPYAELYHFESFSRGYEDTPEKQRRFEKEIALFRAKWGSVLEKGDPYYNPNLTLGKCDFSVRDE